LGSSSYISLPVHSFAGPVAMHIHELANFLQKMKPELLACLPAHKVAWLFYPSKLLSSKIAEAWCKFSIDEALCNFAKLETGNMQCAFQYIRMLQNIFLERCLMWQILKACIIACYHKLWSCTWLLHIDHELIILFTHKAGRGVMEHVWFLTDADCVHGCFGTINNILFKIL
jgi:hypothetical protein